MTGKYTITESVGKHVESVHGYSDLAKHHPSKYEEKGRHYATVDGKHEEVSYTKDGRMLLKKDFILHSGNSANVDVPSPVEGYVYFDKAYGVAKIYDHPLPDGKLTGKVLHMDPHTFHFKDGAHIAYGQGLGIQSGTGKDGSMHYGVHAHVEVSKEQFKKYIHDIDQGIIAPGKYPAISATQSVQKPETNTIKPSEPSHSHNLPANAGGALGNLIAKGEGDYGSFNRGNAGDAHGAKIDFSKMTVEELQHRQHLPKGDPNRLFAVGKYQIIPTTMDEVVKGMHLSGKEKVTPELQERMFSEYLIAKKRPDIKNYITGVAEGKSGLHNAQEALAAEWASVADPDTHKSKYGKSGNNHASISPEQTKEALNAMREQFQTNLKQGMSAEEAYKQVTGMSGQSQSHNQMSIGAGGTTTQLVDRARDSKVTEASTQHATKSHDGLLQHGAHGQEVTDLQTKLKALGAKVQVDGVFGDETLRAVKGYQMMNGLKVDGVYGPNTLAALNTDIARITPQQVHAVTPQPEKAPMTFVDAMKGVTEGQAIASGNTQASIQAPVSPIGDIQVGKVPLTPQDANHPQHKLYESVGKVVQEFEAKNNIPHTQHSEMAVASLTALANKLGMTEVTDFNFDKAKGQFNIGQLNVSPPLVGGMDAGKASITPVQQSFDQMNQLAAVQHREAANEPSLQQQTPPAQEQPKARSM